MEYFAVTVKLNSKNNMFNVSEVITEFDYHFWMSNASKFGMTFLKHVWEYDSRGVLHMHGIATWRKDGLKKRLMLPNYHQKVDILLTKSDIVHWMIYLMKDMSNPTHEELLRRQKEETYDGEYPNTEILFDCIHEAQNVNCPIECHNQKK